MKKHNLIYALLVGLVLLCFNLSAQTTDEVLQNKYWQYRDRFKKYFVNIGRLQGQSLPIATWVPMHRCFEPQRTYNNQPEMQGAKIDMGEGLGNIGDYMAMLATEYYLLKKNNQDVTGTLNEIYYCLNALDRIDVFAEGSFPGGTTTTQNGFMVRDDNRLDYIGHWPTIDNLTFMKSHNAWGFDFVIGDDIHTASQPFDVMTPDNKLYLQEGMEYWFKKTDDPAYAGAPWNGYKKYEYWQWDNKHECGKVDDAGQNPTSGERSEMSQDHFIDYLAGLKFIHKFVDNVYVKPTNSDVGFNLIDKVQEITYRLISFVASQKDISSHPVEMINNFGLLGKIEKSSWFVANPVTNKAVLNGGYLTFGFSYPIAEIGQSITGVDFDYGWQIIRENGTTSKTENWVKNDWWEDYSDNFLKSDVNAQMVSWAVALSGTWDHERFADWAEDKGYPWFELMYAVLHNQTPKVSQSQYEEWLMAPDCNEIAYPKQISIVYEITPALNNPKIIEGPFEYSYIDKNDLHEQVEAQRQDFMNTYNVNTITGRIIEITQPLDHFPFNRNSIYSMPNRSLLDDAYHWGQYNAVDYMLTYNMYRIAEEKFWNTEPNIQYADNACPCLSSEYNLVKRMLVDNNGNNISSISNTFNTLERNLRYSQLGIYTPEFLLHDVDVENGGTINVTASAAFCNAEVEVNAGGAITLTEPSNSDYFKKLNVRNSTLILNDESVLEVENGCTVTIEMGSKLVFNEGATIILNGPNAVLHIKGGLILGSNATFEIQGGADGKGYVIWENNWVENPPQYDNTATIPTGGVLGSTYGASAALVADNSNTVIFENDNGPGNGAGNPALECRGNMGFMTGWGLGKLEIKTCRVNLGPESRIVSECGNTIFNNVDVHGHYDENINPKYNFKRTSMGVHVLGRKNAISNVKVWNCHIGMKLFNVGTYEPLKLTEVDFENCVKSIVNEGGRILYNTGTINGTSGVQRFSAIEGIGTQGKSEINSVIMEVHNYQLMTNVSYKFRTGEYATCLKSHGTGQYFLLNSQLTQADKAIELRESFARPVCTRINENRWAVDMLQNATFNVVNKTYNSFELPTGGIPDIDKYGMIKGRQNNYLLLNNAGNSFHGINGYESFIDVVLHPQNLIEPSSSSNWNTYNSYALPARASEWKMYDGNEQDIWPEGAPNPNVSLYKLINNSPSTLDLATRATISGSTFSSDKTNTCPLYISNNGWKPETTQAQNWANGNAGFNLGSARMPEEIYSMLYVYKENNTGLPDLLGQMKIMLDSTVEDSFAPALHEIYVATHGIYRDVFSDTTIPDSARHDREEDIYDLMLDLQNTLLTRSLDNDNPWRWFKFELDRDLALIHRSFNHRNEGITHLGNVIPNYPDPKDQEALLAWKCILEREQMYLDTLVPYDSVFMYACVPNYYFDDSSHNFVLFGYNPEFWEDDTTGGDTSSPGGMVRQIGQHNPGQQSIQQADTKVKERSKATEQKGSNNSLMLYPNPADNSYRIICSEAISKVKVTDNTGRLVNTYDAKGKHSLQIDASAYSKGIYFIEAYTADKRYIQRLMINR